jgi:hypothetical protein
MNLNGDEKRIRQLFRDMSREEERRAPEFARVMAAASSRTGRSQNGTRLFALAWAVSAVVIAILIAVIFAARHSRPQPGVEPGGQVAEAQPSTEKEPGNRLPAPVVNAPSAPAPRTMPKRVHRSWHSNELAIRMKTLSAWQSPTASLLKAPGEEMLKSLPRLGESLQSIRILSPDEFN